MRWIAAALLAALSLSSHAGVGPVERPDGVIEVVIDGVPTSLPTPLARALAAAVAEHENDPNSLAAALRSLLDAAPCETASECERLAAAVVVYAVSNSNGNADIVAAIVQGVADAVPAAGTETLLVAVGATQAQERRDDPAETTALTTLQPQQSASPTD